jgi:hypothetical protein
MSVSSSSLGFADQNRVRTSPLLHTNSVTEGTLSCYDLFRAVAVDRHVFDRISAFRPQALPGDKDKHPPCKVQVFIPDQ